MSWAGCCGSCFPKDVQVLVHTAQQAAMWLSLEALADALLDFTGPADLAAWLGGHSG